MPRRIHFDYTAPYYYMVTMHAKKGMQPFSVLSAETSTGIKELAVTRRMRHVFFWMTRTVYEGRIRIPNFIIMPNHLHFIVKIEACQKRVMLHEVINKLMSTLSNAYYDALQLPREGCIFEEEWHDWIVLQAGALKTFSKYVINNAHRALYRLTHSQVCFPRVCKTAHHTWTLIGTRSPKEMPVRVPVICSRSIRPGSETWEQWKALAQRLGPGTLAMGTFMSPCEKMVRAEVLKAGGNILHFIPHGIGPKGHASAEEEPLLAAGRLTILTPFSYEQRNLTKQELYDRCHLTLHAMIRALQRGIEELPAGNLSPVTRLRPRPRSVKKA